MLVAEKLLILPFCKYTKFVLQNIRISFRQLLKGILLLTLLLTAGNRHAIAQEPDSLLAISRIPDSLRVVPPVPDSLMASASPNDSTATADTLFVQPKGTMIMFR